MAKIFFTSDLHFGHANVIRYDNRPFASVEEMDRELVKRWNNKVSEEDTVYVLGDVSWYGHKKTRELISSMNGRKVLIRGNHDISNEGMLCGFDAEYDYKEVYLNKKTKIVLCHYPIVFFNRHHYGSYMFYGHVHNSHEWNITESHKRDLERLDIPCNMFNVGCMIWNYEPVTFEEIINDSRFQPVRAEGVEE